jgi:hypothetical protein
MGADPVAALVGEAGLPRASQSHALVRAIDAKIDAEAA